MRETEDGMYFIWNAEMNTTRVVLRVAGDLAEGCPRCACQLRAQHCKLVCDNCGYRRDCSDG